MNTVTEPEEEKKLAVASRTLPGLNAIQGTCCASEAPLVDPLLGTTAHSLTGWSFSARVCRSILNTDIEWALLLAVASRDIEWALLLAVASSASVGLNATEDGPNGP